MKKISLTTFLIISTFLGLSAQTQKKASSASNSKSTASSTALAIQKSIERGKAVYNQTCMACHQADGGGVQGLNPPLIKTEYVLGDKNRLINILLHGMNKELEIDGELYSNPMPSVNYLTDQQIADVLTFVRNNFTNKASAITPAQVKALRAKK